MHEKFILIREISISSWWWGKLNQASSILFMLKIEKITKIFKFESVKATKKKDFSNYFAPQIISSVALQYRKKKKT